ncbi:hypothetical protein [Streptomyces griseoviridis]|uniref:Uncharacterized protein n=1 Tax=Streptomyces griseoviridis TaxID=45398 RepID=A0ABT9LRU7_STRGD|nr:hypothetical protein [Streptomyces griseoviridis]MDP9686252.1 hypothetical protein [Streptomyces griseoviridis]
MDGYRAQLAVHADGQVRLRSRQGTDTTPASGSLTDPRTLLLGRYDAAGVLQYTGRATTVFRSAGPALVGRLAEPAGGHPWTGWTFSGGGGPGGDSTCTWCSPTW